MRITPLISRRLLAVLATLIACLALAACGSSNSTKSASAASPASSAAGGPGGARSAQLVACLKSHGVTLPQGFGRLRRGATGASGAFRPAGRAGAGGGLLFRAGPGGPGGATAGRGFAGRFANNPKLAAAFQACAGSTFRGRFNAAGAKRFRAQQEAVVGKFITCVKQHGFTNVPTPNFSGTGAVFPLSLQKNKQFLAAAKPCASLLQFGRPGAPGAPGGPAGAPA